MAGTRPTAQSRRARPIRISTSDGRPFITHDVTLVSKLRLAASDLLPVLIEGETGTGKELVACLIHEFGGESRPFVIVDCTSLTETLVEVELFGATRGAYTGAVTDRPGLIATANGGTLFLDELPELSLPVQAKLLRLLQEGTYRRVGEDRQRHVSLRIIATTNQGVEMLLAGNKLKRDLFYRLNGHRLHLTPLRESPQVIETLSLCFAEAAGFTGISPSALKALKAYPWPGNVRELEMLIKRVASEGQRGGRLEESLVQEFTLTSRTSSEPTGVPGTLFHARRDAERRTLERAMLEHGGNVSAAARALSMSRQALYKALKRTGLL